MRVEVLRCDRCGETAEIKDGVVVTAGWSGMAVSSSSASTGGKWDLCPSCSKDLREWFLGFDAIVKEARRREEAKA